MISGGGESHKYLRVEVFPEEKHWWMGIVIPATISLIRGG